MLSIWEKETWYAPQDVIIVGGGLMGLWSALELRQRNPSLRITILERNSTPLGASTRNAGFACFGSPTELLHDAAQNGIDTMLSVVEMRYRGIEKIKRYFSKDQLQWEDCGGYECIHRDYKHWPVLADKLDELNHWLQPVTGSRHTFTRNDAALSAMGYQGFDALIETPSEAALHSGQLVQSLTKLVQEKSVTILNGITVKHWETHGASIRVYTEQGTVFTTQKLLFATNGFTGNLVKAAAVQPARGQIILTSPLPSLPWKGTFHFDEGFYYWRHWQNRILIGGARNKAMEEENTFVLEGSITIRTALEDFLRQHLPADWQWQTEMHWSGIMGFTPDKKPLIQAYAPGVYAAIACNGMGVALTPVMAENAAALLLD
jgi:glycine/D-amino acid oxidase-like deaminating enzyme